MPKYERNTLTNTIGVDQICQNLSSFFFFFFFEKACQLHKETLLL